MSRSPFLILLLIALPAAAQPALVEAIHQLSRGTQWQEVARIPVDFDTYHPQGFALVGDELFVSSVEVTESTRRFAGLRDGMDRSAGAGRGHLFKMDLQGRLRAHVELGEGSIYHPGGIDFDGASIWVPVAEYRPNSRSIIYRVDPETMEVQEVFRFNDHIGGIVYNRDYGTLHGVSWGSRRFYTWALDGQQEVVDAEATPVVNPAHYIDYQDCMYAGEGMALCTGLASYRQNQASFRLGGIELVDVRRGAPVHQVPFPFWTEEGLPLTQNPVTFDLDGTRLRMYAMPEDNESRLYVYTSIP